MGTSFKPSALRLGASFLVLAFLTLIGGIACRRRDKEPAVALRPDLGRHFQKHRVEGCFHLYDVAAKRFVEINPERCARRFPPASTFKIFNALIGLDTGVVRDEHHRYAWDGKKRFVRSWNRDHTLASAVEFSALWYFQRLARAVGRKRMDGYIRRMGYGNQDTSRGLDTFWLEGPMGISAREQVRLLRRLARGTLPFSRRSHEIVRRIIVRERTAEHVFRYKTGWAIEGLRNVGWLVGWLERGDRAYFFATNIEARGKGQPFSKDFRRARHRITRAIFTDLGILPRP